MFKFVVLMLVLLTSAQVGTDPDWPAVPLQPGHVVVLGGHTLEFATGGALHATRHRVVVRRRPDNGFVKMTSLRASCHGSRQVLIRVGSCVVWLAASRHAVQPNAAASGVCVSQVRLCATTLCWCWLLEHWHMVAAPTLISAHLVIASKPSDQPCYTCHHACLCSMPQLCHFQIS